MPGPRKKGCDDCGWRDYVYPASRDPEIAWVCSHEAGPDRVAPDGPPWPVCVWWKPRPNEDQPDSYRSKDLPQTDEEEFRLTGELPHGMGHRSRHKKLE